MKNKEKHKALTVLLFGILIVFSLTTNLRLQKEHAIDSKVGATSFLHSPIPTTTSNATMIYHPSKNGSSLPYYKLWDHHHQIFHLPRHPGPPTSLEILEQIIRKSKKQTKMYASDACFHPDIPATKQLVRRVQSGYKNIHWPIINLGMPKVGSSTLFDFFRCANRTATHDQAGFFLRRNVDAGWPPFAQHHDAILQLDANFVPCAYPQIELLDEIHTQYPNATFLLNFRPIQDWIKSAQRWFKMTLRWAQCSIPGLECTYRSVNGTLCTGKDLARWWCRHVQHVREFVQIYQSHALVELDLYQSNTSSQVMARLFAPNATHCWRHSNKNKDVAVTRKQQKYDNFQRPLFSISKQNVTESPSSGNSFAYVFVIAGCDPVDSAYSFYVYNLLISVHILRELGSRADAVVVFQMNYDSPATEVHPHETKWLTSMGIIIYYMQKQDNESFYRTDVEKLKVLHLTQYDKVLFLDSDLIPHANLDYIFYLSERGILMENVGMQGNSEPINGGLWLAKTGSLDTLQERVAFRESCCNMYPYFDVRMGWGHEISPPDMWEGSRKGKKGTKWDFLGAFAGQGILYHHFKYERKSLSIFRADGRVQHWSKNASGHIELLRTERNPCMNYSKPLPLGPSLIDGKVRVWASGIMPRNPPFTDITHFTGTEKPWIVGPPKDWLPGEKRSLESPLHLWFSVLSELNIKLHMGIDFQNWKAEKPKLGFFPAFNQMLGADTNLLSPLILANITSIESALILAT